MASKTPLPTVLYSVRSHQAPDPKRDKEGLFCDSLGTARRGGTRPPGTFRILRPVPIYVGPCVPHRSLAGGRSAFRSGGILVVNGTPVIRSVLSSRTR